MAQTPNYNRLILLRGFANYFDRKIFYYDNVNAYLSQIGSSDYYEQGDINFNPNDGITTTVDLSSLDSSYDEAIDIHTYSYCLVCDNEDYSIDSRWYVMEIVRQTNGIYKVTLRRDVVAESVGNTTFISEAPIYIEKGTLLDNDPLIVNDEKINFNQIKKREIILSAKDQAHIQDPSNVDECVGFIVGYFANDAAEVTGVVSSQTAPTKYVTFAQISAATGISTSALAAMVGTYAPVISGDYFSLTYGMYNGVLAYFRGIAYIPQSFSSDREKYMGIGNFAFNWTHYVASGIWWHNVDNFISKFLDSIALNYSSLRTALQTALQSDFPTEEIITQDQLALLNAYQGATLYDNGNYYKITNIQSLGTEPHAEIVISKGELNVIDDAVTYAVSQTSGATQTNNWEVYLNYSYDKIKITLENQQIPQGVQATIKTSHNALLDAPYSMFVIPFGSVDYLKVHNNSTPVSWTLTKKEALALANDIAVKLDDGLYDLQLLPYMPEADQYCDFGQDNTVDVYQMTNEKDFCYVYRSGENDPIGAILFPTTSSSSFSINAQLELEHSMKVDSQCCFYRLCSPNYSGIFEFNLAKNGGKVLSFYADCTFKPFNPFIRVTPQFDFLYGSNFKDGRGLICGGDFSLPILKDRWYNYELNNKNFGSIFAREIQNLDVNFTQERIKEGVSIGAGVVGAGAGGAATGFKMGGGYGALAGAAVGATAGIVGGYMDAQVNEALRREQRRYAMDRFNLNLGNVKAIPESLTRVSSYTVISKIFPFLEFYTATDEEIEAFKNKIKFDGMTVGRIGNLFDFMGGNNNLQYVKGQIIRAEGINEDDHYIMTLYDEIAKGVYI